MLNDFDEMEDLLGLDDDAEFGLDEDEDELGLDEESEFGDDDEDDFGDDDEEDFGDDDEEDFGDDDEDDFGDDDDREDLTAQSDDPSDPEDDSGPDINGESPSSADAMGGIFTRRGRYTRQQRIFRNRYKRAVKRADRRRGGEGVRRRMRNTWRRLQRLWGRLNEKRRVGLKSPGQTRKAVAKLYGPLPQDEGKEGRSSAPVYPRAGIAAGLISAPTRAAVPPLTAFQSQEVSQQAQATNYAQRFSAPPTRVPQYTPGLAPSGVSIPGASMMASPALDQLDSMTNDRLWKIASGNGMGVFSMPPARMRARQILRSRGVDPAATNPAAVRPAMPGPVGMPGAGRSIESMTNDRLLRIASGQAPGALATPAARMSSRQELRSRGVDTSATNPASRRYQQPTPAPSAPTPQAPMRPGFTRRAAVAPSLPTSTVPAAVQAAISPKGPIAMRASIRPMGPAGLSMSARFSPGARPGASANMGFDTYGLEPGAVAPIAPDGYSVVPDFTTLSLSAIKEHPLKTIASVAGLFVAGAFLARPVGNLIRSRIG
jgi:hypothetical protein